MIRKLLMSMMVCAALTTGAEAERTKFLRYPHVSNDGTLAFSYHGDIWLAEPDGSNPRRLTAHIARDTFPRFSPDGQQIAFNSDRMGNTDVWVVPVSGGRPTQVTVNSTSDTLLYWTPDGKEVLIASSRGAGTWGSPLYCAPIDGSLPHPMAMDRGAAGMIRQDGKKIAFNRIGFRYWRKHYRGNNNTDIWVQDLDTNELVQLTDLDPMNFREHTQDAHPMWGADGKIYFLSEKEGIFNIWRISPEGGAAEQVTQHMSDGVQYPAISPDGKAIVYENEFELWKLSIPDGAPERIEIDMSFDPKDNLTKVLTTENSSEGFSPSPDGSHVAVGFHGELFVVPSDAELGEMTQVTQSPWRDRYQQYSPDGKYLAYVSDQSGDEEIWLYDTADLSHRQLTDHESNKRSFVWSPDSSGIVFSAANKLFHVTLEGGTVEELAHNPEGGFSIGHLSKNNRWLTYSRSNSDLNTEVYLFDVKNRTEYNVTQSRFSEYSGQLTPDGKHVVFMSNRDDSSQLYVVSLARMTADPDDPLVRQQAQSKENGQSNDNQQQQKQTPGEDEKGEPEEGSQSGEQTAEDAASSEDEEAAEEEPSDDLEIDLHRIEDRARQITRGDDVRGFMLSPKGDKVYYRTSSGLYSVDLDGRNEKRIGEGSFGSLTMTPDGKHFFYSDGDGIHRMSASGGSKKKIEFELRVTVDVEKEWEQVFEEAWRVMKYRFYDEDMHGKDWDAIKAQYKPMLKYVGENQDLYDLCNEMIGELNASHTGVSGPASRDMESLYRTRHLGFELEPSGEYYCISHIYPKGPADKEWLELAVGDYVLEIEGKPIRSGDNYYRHLNELLNDYVDIKVASPGESSDADAQILGESRDVRIRSTSSVSNLKYEAWVEGNRRKVDEWSSGKIGYVHIRSMNRSSLARFETEIDQFWNKNGMIIDIRYNGGGNIDQELIDILERRPYEYWNSRWGGRARGRRPRQAIAGPKVMLINWRSASDSEVTPQGFRDLELGRIVGNPTYGAVIATGSYSLLNGGRIRTPGALVVTYDPTQPNNYGINLENFGVAPDVWVENSPQDELDGFDRELKGAVEEAQRMLAEGTWQYGEDDPVGDDQ